METRNSLLINAIMERAEMDPIFRARLLTEPEAVAAEHKVRFDEAEIAQLKRVGELHRLVDEIRAGHRPGPIFYPVYKYAGKRVAQIMTRPHWPDPGYTYPELAEFLEIFREYQAKYQAAKATTAGK